MNRTIPAFLIEMSKQMHEQDNRITAEPIWQVRCKRFRPTAQGYSDIFHILDTENDYGLVANSSSDININQQIVNYLDCDPDDLPIVLESWVDGECELTDGQEKIDYFLENFDIDIDEIDGFDVIWVEEYVDIVKSAFLTEVDANWFIQRKQHDYPKLYTYVVSMYLCPQMIELRNWILSLTNKCDGQDAEKLKQSNHDALINNIIESTGGEI
jgi:hypothetical protein